MPLSLASILEIEGQWYLLPPIGGGLPDLPSGFAFEVDDTGAYKVTEDGWFRIVQVPDFAVAVSPQVGELQIQGAAMSVAYGQTVSTGVGALQITGAQMSASITGGVAAVSSGNNGWWLDDLGTDPLSITVVAPAALAGTYNIDPADFATGPLLLTNPTVSGTTGVGDTLTAVPGLMASDDANGPPSFYFEWYRGGVLVSEGPTYTVASGDDLIGVTLRQVIGGELGDRFGETAALALASYSQQGITLDGRDIAISAGPIATTDAEALALTVFMGFDNVAAATSLQRVLDIPGFRIQRTAGADLSVRLADDNGATHTQTFPIAQGDTVNVIAVATWDATNGMGIRLAYKLNDGAVVTTAWTYSSSNGTELDIRHTVGIGGRNTAASANDTEERVDLYRAALWPGVTADLSDPSVFGAFAATDGSLVDLSGSVGLLGMPVVDWHGANANALSGEHDGSQGDLTITGTPTLAS